MNKFQESFNESIRKLYALKPNVAETIIQSTKVTNYDLNSKILKLHISKPFVFDLIKSGTSFIKTYLENKENCLINYVEINGKLIDIEHVKSLANSFNHHQASVTREMTISEKLNTDKTIEQTLETYLSSDLDFFNTNKKTIKLEFYNPFLNEYKNIIVNPDKYNTKKLNMFALIFIWTLIVPLILLPFILNKKYKWNKLIENVKTILLLKFQPLNRFTKEFVKNYIK